MSKVYIVKSSSFEYSDYEEKIECVSLDKEVAERFKDKYNKNLKSKKTKKENILKKLRSERSKSERTFLNNNLYLLYLHEAWIEEYELI